MTQTQPVGRYTAALTLIAIGAAFLIDNLLGVRTFTRLLWRLWPLMLVSLGAEYLVRMGLTRRHPDQEVRFRPDTGGILVLVLVAFLAVGTAIRPVISGQEVHTISAAGVKELQIDLAVGSLEIKPGSAGEIRLEASSISLLPIWTEPSHGANLQITQGPVVTVTTQDREPSRFGTKLVVYAPPGLKLKASTDAGNIRVTDYEGPMELETDVGTIRVDEFRGSLTAETETGQIRATTATPLEGPVHLETETGQISLTVPAGSSMQVTAETRTGSLHLPGFVTIIREGASARGEGSTGGGQYPVTLEAATGSVTMKTR